MSGSRRPSPLGGRKPTRADLARFSTDDPHAIDDVLPPPGAPLRLLIVGINPGLWTAAVNAPFARPGNRFWPSLYAAGLTDHEVDASLGLTQDDETHLAGRGIGISNLVGRATARADELSRDELREGGADLVARVIALQPSVVALAGITAFRTAFGLPKAQLGHQDPATIEGWPHSVGLWVVPQPSGLNAHETIDSLADKWREVWAASGMQRRSGERPRVSTEGPQTQLTDQSSRDVWDALAGAIFSLPGVVEGESSVSPQSTRAVFIEGMDTPRIPEASLAPDGRWEPAHLHGPDDTSLHLVLPRERGLELERLGWAEPHHYGEFGTEWLVYGPRDGAELDVVLAIVREGISWARGTA